METPFRSEKTQKENIHFDAQLRDWLKAQMETEPIGTSAFRDRVQKKFQEFAEIKSEHTGEHEAHNNLANFLYSSTALQALMELHSYSETSGDTDILNDTSTSLLLLEYALKMLDQNSDGSADTTVEGRLAQMQNRMLEGDFTLPAFLRLMNHARETTSTALSRHGEKVPEAQETVQKALKEFKETEHGITFDESFQEQLNDPNTKALVLSLDYNSTWTRSESFAHSMLIAKAIAELEELSQQFKATYPDKELYAVINTGRPGMYAWGVIEALSPIRALRKIALAESGGVYLKEGMAEGKMEVAVEHAVEWGDELDRIKMFFLKQMRNRNTITVEPKNSMLSIQIAQREKDGGEFLHTDTTNQSINDNWFDEKTKNYFNNRYIELRQERQMLSEQLAAIEPSEAEGEPKESVQRLEEHLRGEIAELDRLLTITQEIQQQLVVQFNPTAGYVDIGHRDLNKYSTLKNQLAKRGIAPNESLIVHIGDSNNDKMPTQQTGAGENNDGAEQVFLVGVSDSANSLKQAVEERGPRGVMTARESILGLLDMFKGIRNTFKRPTA